MKNLNDITCIVEFKDWNFWLKTNFYSILRINNERLDDHITVFMLYEYLIWILNFVVKNWFFFIIVLIGLLYINIIMY